MTITLYQPPGGWGEPSMSPFCIKLECYLKMAGIDYKVAPANPQKAPKGKMPYVKLPDGSLLGDSQQIIEWIKATHGDKLDAHLSADQKATGHMLRRMIEEGTYFCGVYGRWVDDEGWPHTRAAFARFLPGPVRFLLPLIRRRAKQSVVAQGTGRHSASDVYAMGVRDFEAVAQVLGDKSFLFGETPSSYDATLYGFLEANLVFPRESPMQAGLLKLKNLVAYRERMRAKYFPQNAPKSLTAEAPAPEARA